MREVSCIIIVLISFETAAYLRIGGILNPFGGKMFGKGGKNATPRDWSKVDITE